jgi:AcrR family transcriptional regulator
MTARPAQLSREDWIAEARKVLVTSGIDDVKVDRLARKLKVTRGSFYWHFRNRKELLDALLSRWESQNVEEMEQIRARTGSDPNTLEVVRIWLGEDPAYPTFDMAIRFWARKSRPVAALVRDIDDRWISLLQSMFRQRGLSELESFARARIFYFHQIGYYALAIEESLDDRLRLAPYYHLILVGDASPDELERLGEDLRAQARKPAAKRRRPEKD